MLKKAVQQGRSELLLYKGWVGGMIPTARIERAQFHRARSASKGIVPATPAPFFSILLCFGFAVV